MSIIATKTDVANEALERHLGIPRISNITDTTSVEAKACNRAYDSALEVVLSEDEWGFARAEVTLALEAGETSVVWGQIYGYPSDCVTPIKIHNPSSEDVKIPFDIGTHSSGTSKVILTDQATATLIYTKEITHIPSYTAGFVEALACQLAIKVAMGTTRLRNMVNSLQADYLALLLIAKKNNKKGQHKEQVEDRSFITART
jgi:hypothetical protein